MSLDGFIADTCDAADQLFDWHTAETSNSSAPAPTGSPQQPPATCAQRGPTSARSYRSAPVRPDQQLGRAPGDRRRGVRGHHQRELARSGRVVRLRHWRPGKRYRASKGLRPLQGRVPGCREPHRAGLCGRVGRRTICQPGAGRLRLRHRVFGDHAASPVLDNPYVVQGDPVTHCTTGCASPDTAIPPVAQNAPI
jgi:hypothetical protein